MKKIFFAFAILAVMSSGQALAASKDSVNKEKQTLEQPDYLDNSDNVKVNDPIEPVNRAIFKFNNVVDHYLLAPVARGYKWAIPQWGRQRVTNVFYNISEPVTVLNSALQADPENAFTSLWRFIINSTFGILGVFDVASELGLKPRQEDFGQTFAAWGWTDAPYFVIPILGPSTIRDGIGLVGDYYTNPFYNGMLIEDEWTRIGMAVVNGIDTRANLLPITDDIEKHSLDPYATYRSAYMQKRENDIHNGYSDDAKPTKQ